MEMLSQLLGIGFVLGLLVGALWWLRRKGLAQIGARRFTLGKSSRYSVLELIESRGLGPGHAVHLIRVADRAVVLTVHPAGSSVVDSRPWREIREYAEGGR